MINTLPFHFDKTILPRLLYHIVRQYHNKKQPKKVSFGCNNVKDLDGVALNTLISFLSKKETKKLSNGNFVSLKNLLTLQLKIIKSFL